jgi:hypothetical protein
MTDADGEVELIESNFRLDEVDEERGRAHLPGSVRWTETVEGLGTAVYDARASLRVDLAGQRIERLELRGTGVLEGRVGDQPVEGRLTFESELTTSVGPVAENALREKPVVRDVPRMCEAQGVRFDLPADWVHVPVDVPDQVEFYWTRSESDVAVLVRLLTLGDAPLSVVMKNCKDELEASGQAFRM